MVSNEKVDTAAASEPVLKMSDLSETERSAASLGVDPAAWKPIGWINEGHYDSLLKENRIDSELAKKVEAYRHVASGGA
jgi:hypothetical protein